MLSCLISPQALGKVLHKSGIPICNKIPKIKRRFSVFNSHFAYSKQFIGHRLTTAPNRLITGVSN